MFGLLKRDTPGIASVFFRGNIAPRAEEFAFLEKGGIGVSPRPAGPGAQWALHLRHPQWGEADMVCLRDMRPPSPALLEYSVGLTQTERTEAAAAGTAVSIHAAATRKDVLRDRKNLLRFARAVLGDDGVMAADHTSERFWSRAGLDEELAHDADLDISALYCVHAVTPDGSERVDWLHTHGLAAAGAFDFDVVRPSEDLLSVSGDDILRAIAFAILEGHISESTPAFPLAQPGGMVRFVPAERFQSHAAPADCALRGDDGSHTARRAIVCEPAGGLLGRFSTRVRPSRFLSGPLDEIAINFSPAATELTARRARGTLHLLTQIMEEVAEFQFPAIAKMVYETPDGGNEHLWFTVHAVNGDRIDATLESQPFNIPGMNAGDRAGHGAERLTDWAVMTPFGPINPRTQMVRRMIRQERDTLLHAMRSFQQGG
jgi:hypothetical protein